MHDPTGGERDLRARVIRVLTTRASSTIRPGSIAPFASPGDSIHDRKTDLKADEGRDREGRAARRWRRRRIWRELFLAMDEDIGAGDPPRDETRARAAPRCSARRELDAERFRREGTDRANASSIATSSTRSALLHGDASRSSWKAPASQKRARNVVQIANDCRAR